MGYEPFKALEECLQTAFLIDPERKAGYTIQEIQRLKQATDTYQPDSVAHFNALRSALLEAIPYLKRTHIHFETLKKSMNDLASKLKIDPIDWQREMHTRNIASRLSKTPIDPSSVPGTFPDWVHSMMEKPFDALSESDILQIMEEQVFYQKLKEHLSQHPDFLFDTMMASKEVFAAVIQTRLILYITDPQLAQSIIKHAPSFFINLHPEKPEQVDVHIHKINSRLSCGRSVSTLLRNADAKAILDGFRLFDLYQQNTLKTHATNTPSL